MHCDNHVPTSRSGPWERGWHCLAPPKNRKKPSNPSSQAFAIKELLRFYFILFVYLFVYYHYFFWWRGGGWGGGEFGVFEGHLVTQTNPKMRAVSPLSLVPNQKVN